MSWRRLAGTLLFSPILVGLLVFGALLFVWKLPTICCERWRAVRYLPYAGLTYYGLAIPLVLGALELAWWKVVIGTALFALSSDWLLPDPITFVLSPRKRRAVRLAIEYLENGEGPGPNYGMVSVVGSEAKRLIVSVALLSDTIPPGRRFLAVADDTTNIEVLNFEYVSTRYSVHPWL